MQFHVDMTSVFSSGPLIQTMISYILRFLEGVCNLIFLIYLTNDFPAYPQLKWPMHLLNFIIEEMSMALLQLWLMGTEYAILY